jgi:hypothetical protein
MPLLGPELALGIPRCSAREAIKNWTEYWTYAKLWHSDVQGAYRMRVVGVVVRSEEGKRISAACHFSF